MRPADRHAFQAAFLIVGALVLLVAGCGSDRISAPSEGRPAAGGQFIMDQAAPSLDGSGCLPAEKKSPESQVNKLIDGSKGGTVQAGRYVVDFTPGAFAGAQLVSVVDPKNSFVECRLFPEGLTFSKDVTLTIDLTGTSGSGDDRATIYWFNPETRAWVDIGGHFNPKTNTVSAKLKHFSTYRAGRAGW